MRITSERFDLNPGFEAEGQKFTGAKVRLLTRNERDSAEALVQQKAAQEIRAAQKAAGKEGSPGAPGGQPDDLDAFLKFAIAERVRARALSVLGIECFVSTDGAEIRDRDKIEAYCGLLTEPDEEAIADEQQGLRDRFRRPKFRPQPGAAAEDFGTRAAG